MSSIISHSVWATGAIPPEEWKYRNLKRVVFPGIDLVLTAAGLTAFTRGIPAITEFYPVWVTTILASVLTTAGVVSFLGVSFPKLWPMELVGKVILLGILVIYFASLFVLTFFANDDSRSFVMYIALGFIIPIGWRMGIAGVEWQERRLLSHPHTNDKGE